MHPVFVSLVLAHPSPFPATLGPAVEPAASRPSEPQLVHWLDANADGRADMLVVSAAGTLDLLLATESGGFHAADATWTVPLGPSGTESRATLLGLAPGPDGEVLVLRHGASPSLLKVVEGRLIDATLGSGLEDVEALREASFVDYDGDGIADLQARTATGAMLLFHGRAGGRYEGTELPTSLAPPFDAAVTRLNTAEETRPDMTSAGPSANASGAGVASPGARFEGAATVKSRGTGPRGVRTPLDSAGAATGEIVEELAVAGLCAISLRDQATGACVRASSTPTPGMLLPLGPELFVDGFGNVGIGTESPSGDLHVHAYNAGLRLTPSNSGPFVTTRIEMSSEGIMDKGILLETTDAGFGIKARAEDRVGAIGTFGPHFFVRKTESPKVGVGTADPLSTLHVAGQMRVDEGPGGRTPVVVVTNQSGQQTADLTATGPNGDGAVLAMRQGDGAVTFNIDAENYSGSELTMFDADGTETFELRADELLGNGASLKMRNGSGVQTIKLDAHVGNSSELSMDASNGQETVEILAEEFNGDGAQLTLRRYDGVASIVLDASVAGQGLITTDVLAITGGSDLVEGFDTAGAECPPGSVVVIDEEQPGALALSTRPYDRRVAGIVSGAGGIRAGLRLGQKGVLDGETPVALSGRVYVRACDENGVVRPGDLLTSSSTSGVAMRATDTTRSHGAILGKAMTGPDAETGLVLVLVNLQ